MREPLLRKSSELLGIAYEPIYKLRRIHTVASMVKRILTVALGVVLGSCVALGVAKLAFLWGLFSDKDLDRSSEYVREVLQLVNENYVEAKSVQYTSLAHAAIHGIADSLDPHSEFMEAKEYQQLQEDMSSEFGGVGIQVELRKTRVIIVAPIAGGPSERAGIQRGDEIMSIDGQRIEKATIESVVSKLRGKPKTITADNCSGMNGYLVSHFTTVVYLNPGMYHAVFTNLYMIADI